MYNNLQNEAQFLKKNEVYSNIGNSTSKQQEGQIIKNIDLVTLKTGTDKDVEDLKKAASGHTVKKVVDKLVQDINKEIVSILNTELQTTRAKNQSLKDIIGDSEAGLVKDLKDLKEQVNSLMPEEAPPHINTAGEHELL
ncbi:MAG: hypothetical protein LKM45_06440 [Wolbachia endosymbiont of Alcedoecus sp.]|nr:hypothetical protein [Wolbachia endosymbiont of Alcedoecus sp.]